jgi:hypothetical protein
MMRDNTVVHRTVPCAYCKKPYLSPCDEKRKTTCTNFLFKTGKLKPAKAERVMPKAKGKRR